VAVFFVAGLLLSLTPCVLPMLPILVSIIVGQGAAASRRRALGLAVCYSLGMALVYTALGIAAGLAGEGLAAWLQKPIVLAGFAVLLAVLALSMFGAYNLQIPEFIAGRLTQTTQRLPGGRWLAVFAMGAVSALIVSPCVAAPLAGALVYISQTRDVLIGGTALFALACGMGVPLVVVGASAGKLMPRAGAWMEDIKFFFGLVLLGMALWTVQILLPGPLVLILWGGLALGGVLRLVRQLAGLSRSAVFWRRVGAIPLALIAVGQWAGAAGGGADPLKPWAAFQSSKAALTFAPVHSLQELSQALARSAASGRPTLLDFYADWCVSCKEMERYTYTDPQVQQKLAGVNLLKADVTANTDEERALLRQFGLFGPPGTLLFDAQGREIRSARIVGYEDAQTFLASLKRAGW
jgi:thiol:disulfide interchange protein DsbD